MLQDSENNAFNMPLIYYVEHHTLRLQKNLQWEQKDMQKILVNHEITSKKDCKEKAVMLLSLIWDFISISPYSEAGANWGLDSNWSFFQYWVLKPLGFHRTDQSWVANQAWFWFHYLSFQSKNGVSNTLYKGFYAENSGIEVKINK